MLLPFCYRNFLRASLLLCRESALTECSSFTKRKSLISAVTSWDVETLASQQIRAFHSSLWRHRMFWERDEKGGYRKETEKPPRIQMIREGLKELKEEIKLWREEVKEKFEGDPILIYRPGKLLKWAKYILCGPFQRMMTTRRNNSKFHQLVLLVKKSSSSE